MAMRKRHFLICLISCLHDHFVGIINKHAETAQHIMSFHFIIVENRCEALMLIKIVTFQYMISADNDIDLSIAIAKLKTRISTLWFQAIYS